MFANNNTFLELQFCVITKSAHRKTEIIKDGNASCSYPLLMHRSTK